MWGKDEMSFIDLLHSGSKGDLTGSHKGSLDLS